MGEAKVVETRRRGSVPQAREAILAAARGIVERSGHEGLRVRDVAFEAGFSVGNLYHAFSDLDGLALAIKARVLDELRDAVAVAGRAVGDPIDAMVAMGLAYHAYAVANPALWRLLFHHGTTRGPLPEWYAKHLDEVLGGIAGPLRAAVPSLGEAEAARAGKVIFAGVHGVVALGVQERLGPTTSAEVAASVEDLVRSYVRGYAAES